VFIPLLGMNYRFICTSSKAGQGVELAFSKLVEEIMEYAISL